MVSSEMAANVIYDGGDEFLPVSVKEWAGLSSHSPAAGGEALTTLNDGQVPFDEIADRIERYL